MSDDHGKLLDDLGDLDWDSALDEWEKNTFVPEVQRDADTNKVAPPNADESRDEPKGSTELKAGSAQGSLKDLSSEGTVIAPVPKELRGHSGPGGSPEPPKRPTNRPPPIAPPHVAPPPQRSSTFPGAARGGGLGQLFSKGTSVRPPGPAAPPPHAPPPAPPRAHPPSEKTRVVPQAFSDAETQERPAVDFLAVDRQAAPSSKFPSITRQVASPSVPVDAYEEETLIGRSVEDAEKHFAATMERERAKEPEPEPAPTESARLGSMSDADTATRLPEAPGARSAQGAERIGGVGGGAPDYDDDAQTRIPGEVTPSPRAVAPPPTADSDRTIQRQASVHDLSASAGAASSPSPADDDEPTFMRPSPSQAAAIAAAVSAPSTDRERPPAPEGPTEFEGEKPVSRWLDEATTTAFRQRASWLEEEARAIRKEADRGRALLGVSELLALVGDTTEAFALATEARNLAPDLSLAWRQARQLGPRDSGALVEALDAEAATSPTAAARAHAMLVGADVLRTSGDGDAAVARWDSAYKLDPADVRAPAARAALALAQGNHSIAGADLAENSELIALDRAVATALKLRGVPRPGTDVETMPINDALRRARTALLGQDVVGAAQALAEIASEPTLLKPALWLSSALGATHIAGRRAAARALKTLAGEGEELARRQLAARGIELGDPELVSAALADDGKIKGFVAIEPLERATLLVLAGQDATAELEGSLHEPELNPLVDALTSSSLPANEEAALVRAGRSAGREAHRTVVALGRLLAARASAGVIDTALAAVPSPRAPAAAGVALEVAVTMRRWDEVSEALSGLPTGEDAGASAQRHVAAAIVAERAGNRENAKRAWREALVHGAAHDSVVRALASLDDETDLGAELLTIADAMPDGPASAIVRLEVLARSSTLGEAERSAIVERVHRGAPALGIGAFLAERIGRRKGDVDEVVRWIGERRTYANDSLETALDAVREALLVADKDADLASTRLEEAHRSRPDDVALRELYERLAVEPPADRGDWRERRAMKSSGPTRNLLLTEAAIEYERAGNPIAALRTAKLAKEEGDAGLSRVVAARAEIATGATEQLKTDLTTLATDTENDDLRRDTYARLAELDGHGRNDAAAALEWHRRILEEAPRNKASLRFVENALIGAGEDEELERVFEKIAIALDGTAGGEVTGHAQLAARLKTRVEGGWERTGHMARLAATQPEPSLWALRALNAHARVQKDEEATLSTTTALLERTQRPAERAALLLRASEAAARQEQVSEARGFLEQAAQEDPGDVVTWGFLAEVRERTGETRAAAEACESLARTSVVGDHQVLAWFDAARIWLDEVKDPERGMTALEQCAEVDVTHGDVFTRLSALYSEKHLDAELARLLEKRLAMVDDENERVGLEVELARTLGEMGDLTKAKAALESALAHKPDHTTALGAMADLCAKEGDWQGAEQAYVRLARLLVEPAEQRAIYEKLGEIYSVHSVNLSRAEVAYKEVLKRAPNDMGTLEKLIDIYKRQGDIGRAVETQQQIISEATDPAIRLQRLIDLAAIHETTAKDARRSEQVLESARKEFPTSVVALRAMAEFYSRQRQMPAMQILLDRAAGDARRSFAAGRFVTSLFEVLHAAYELRGRKDAARVVAATLAAVEGHPAELVGAEVRAVDPRLDDVLAPELVGPAMRALFARAGDALDAVSPVDLRALRATPLQPGSPLGTTVGAIATVVGLGALQILVSPQLGRVAIPLGTNPPALLVGEGLTNVPNERARSFVVVRAMKMILERSSFLLRGQPDDVAVLVSALFTAFNPSFAPQGVDAKRVSEMSKRLVPALPRNMDPTVGVIALEAAGTLGDQAAMIAGAAQAWANRVALLAIGDPNGALDGIAWSKGEEAAPRGSEERAAWIARNAEARELMTFSVTDPYSEARARLGLDR